MADSVGVISLDLVIKNKVQEQLDKISASIKQGFEKPTQQAERAVENAMDKTVKTIDEGFGSASETARKSMQDAISACRAELDKLEKKAQEAATKTETAAPKTVKVHYDPEYDPSKVQAEVDRLADEIAQRLQGKAKSGAKEASDEIVQQAQQGAEEVRKPFEQLRFAMSEIGEGGKICFKKAFKGIKEIVLTPIRGIKSTISALFIGAKKIILKSFEGLKTIKYYIENPLQAIKKMAVSAASLIKSTLGGAFKAMKSVGSKAVETVKAKFNKLTSVIQSSSKPLSKLTSSLTRAAKSVFLMAGAYAAFRGIKSLVANAVGQNEEFAKSLNEIKANLTVAFTPIMSTVMPYLNALMAGVAAAAKTVAAFVSELFGTTYQQSLQATKQAQKSADKIKKTQDTYLADFDVVRVAQDDSKSDTDSSDSSQGIDYSAISGDDVKLPDWAERMKDAIKSGDWAGVGKLLAAKVNKAANIDWTPIRKKLCSGVRNVVNGLNAFVAKLDWNGLGSSLGGGINTVFSAAYTFMSGFDWAGFGRGTAQLLNSGIAQTDWSLVGATLASKWSALIGSLYAFVTEFDWSGFGAAIGSAVNGWFNEIDWAKLGKTVSASVSGVLDTAIHFLQTVNWKGIGEKIWKCVSSIEWSEITSKMFRAIGSAVSSTVSLLWGFIREAVYKIRDYFSEKIQDCGGNIVRGLFKGIKDAFKNVGKWIYANVFEPFITGFKKCFGIHSPSTVMAEMGGYIIQGLYNAVAEGIAKVKEIFTKLLDAVKGVFSGIGKWFKRTFMGAFLAVKSVLSSIILFVKGIFAGGWKKAWQGVKSIFKSVWDTLYGIVKTPIDLIIGAVNTMTSAVENAINWIIDGINSLSFDVPDWVPGIGGETFGFDLDTISIPEIPKLATGGLATAPTLAMVGDNRNAKADPEVISPLSKLQGMLDNGRLEEVIRLLGEILDWLKAFDPVFFGTVDGRVLFKCMQDMNSQYKRKTGVSAF